MQEQTKDLLCYLWDNYIEINTGASLTLMGVGDAYLGIKQLLTSRGTSSPSLALNHSKKENRRKEKGLIKE